MFDLAGQLQEDDRVCKAFLRFQSRYLGSQFNYHNIVKDIISALNLVGGKKVERLEMAWIKAQVGLWGNEEAERLARESVNQTPNVHGMLPPYTHLKLN